MKTFHNASTRLHFTRSCSTRRFSGGSGSANDCPAYSGFIDSLRAECVVSRIVASDVPKLLLFYRKNGLATRPHLGEMLFALFDADELIACCRLEETSSTLVLRGLCVAEGSRRKGLGRWLVQQARVLAGDRTLFALATGQGAALMLSMHMETAPKTRLPRKIRHRLRSYERGNRLLIPLISMGMKVFRG